MRRRASSPCAPAWWRSCLRRPARDYARNPAKDALADYASEQFEVACYTVLAHAATELRHHDVARLCRQNLEEDRAMAEWLLQQLSAVVSQELFQTTAARARR